MNNNTMNFEADRETLNNQENIGVQLSISNRIAILDRLHASESITTESYVEELKELLALSIKRS